MNNILLLEVKNLSKSFGGLRAVDNLSFKLYSGEVLSILGENGAGKSTLIKMISGALSPTKGEIFFENNLLSRLTPRYAQKIGVATIYQELALADNIDIPGNVFLGEEIAKKIAGFGVLNKKRMIEETEVLLDKIKAEFKDLLVTTGEISGGQRQAVAIARALRKSAKILIMDEPTASLAVNEVKKVRELIRELKKNGVGIILISHNIEDTFSVADRLLVMRNGRNVGERLISRTNENEVFALIMGITGE